MLLSKSIRTRVVLDARSVRVCGFRGSFLSIYDASRQLIFTRPLSGRNFFAVKPQAMQRRGIRYGIKNGVLSAAAIDMFVPGPTRDDEHVVRAPFESFVADDRLAFSFEAAIGGTRRMPMTLGVFACIPRCMQQRS